ncbi:hypothetical protein N7532_001659 [Penicillium argentinense]|uniref:Elongator complex protein 6 n=1 Tax=Penicillium argentinense TaxID=1131581 RepID=A0A9W9G2X6_9EURO|nr:uncharacterized protein N7532_001659 [Penicillium argentinense]KAJ5111124.1 hypothetical protein N7532_001659 [Penicillium argentinense]
MPSQPPLPHLLVPYLSDQTDSSLTLISSILGATSNWLVLRFLHAALSSSSSPHMPIGVEDQYDGKKRKVVLVSFMRGWEFWKSEAKRLGLDLTRLSSKQQFTFVDGLSELFSLPQNTKTRLPAQHAGAPARTALPLRSQSAVPDRMPPQATPADQTSSRGSTEPIAKKLHFSGHGITALNALGRDIQTVIEKQKISQDDEILLIIDQPDLLLASTGPSQAIGATEMMNWLTGLQLDVHSTVLTLAADSPLLHNASASSNQMANPTEAEHAAFSIGLAHRARSVMQLRTLETGAARDVSGVLRISRGGGWTVGDDNLDERELLFYIQRDGGVRVFGRGES